MSPYIIVFVLLIGGKISAQSNYFTLRHDSVERQYQLFLPSAYDEETPLPLVIALHPSGADGADMREVSRFDEHGETFDTIVVYPDAIDGRWNSGMSDEDADDVGFIRVLIRQLASEYAIDPTRIYAFGYSNGGSMVHRLRCSPQIPLTAVAVFASPLTFQVAQDCLNVLPEAVLMLHGVSDEVFPFDGSARARPDRIAGTLSVEQTVMFMASLNDCNLEPIIRDVGVEFTLHPMTRESYTDCTNDAFAELILIEDWGHYEFPGWLPILQPDGEPGMIAEVIWKFFLSYPINNAG